MSRRKYATYQCLGAACPIRVRLRIPASGRAKYKPPRWKYVIFRTQDGDTGIVREARVTFCSQQCQDSPDEEGELAQRIKRFLEVAPPPAMVRYQCVVCGSIESLLNPEHSSQQLAVPVEWTTIPLFAVDYENGVTRLSNLPICSEACSKKLDPELPADQRPPAVQAEMVRLYGTSDGTIPA